MKKLAEICIQRPVFAAMLVLALVVVGARQLLPARRRSLPGRRSADGHRPHAAAGRLARGDRDAGQRSCSRRRQHRRGHQRAALDLRRRAARIVDRHVRPRSRHRRAPRRTCATASRSVLRRLPRDVEPPIVAKLDSDSSPGHVDRALGQPLAARADRDRRQDRQGRRSSARPASARCRSSAASSAPSTSGSTPTGWPPTSCRSPRCATRWRSRTPTCPAATSPTGVSERTLRTMGRFADAERVQRPGDRHAQRRADPRARHRPRRGRHQGAAHRSRASTACRPSSSRCAGSRAPTRSR